MTEIIGHCFKHKTKEHVKKLEITRGSVIMTFDCGFESKIFFEE